MVDTSLDGRLGRIFMNRTIKVYPEFADFFGMEETIERIVGFFRHAAQGLEERKQILYLLGPVGGGKSSLAERLKQLMEKEPVYVLKAGKEVSPVFESPLGPVRPADARRRAGKALRGSAAPADRHDLALGGQAARGVRRRHHQIHRGAAAALAPQADLHRQDRARRREQPGRLEPRRQGRYPQARVLQPERSRRLFLLGRAQPHHPGACSNSSRCSRPRSRCCTRS